MTAGLSGADRTVHGRLLVGRVGALKHRCSHTALSGGCIQPLGAYKLFPRDQRPGFADTLRAELDTLHNHRRTPVVWLDQR